MFKEKIPLKETIDRVNKETRERHFNILIKGSIRIVGVVSLILGIILAFVIVRNYMYNNNWQINFDQTNISSLGDLLAGTVGVLFAVAGVSFLIITIYQNRDEMEQTRAIFKTQLAESTFFKLLELHKELVTGLENKSGINLSQAVKNSMKAVCRYKKHLEEAKFHHFDDTKNSPIYQYNTYSEMEIAGKSLVHLLNHIQNNLTENAEFYHTTVYNNLSFEQKCLIGMIVQNKLVPGLQFYTYPYSEAYLELTEMEILPVLFPVIEIKTKTYTSGTLTTLHPNDDDIVRELETLSGFTVDNIYGEQPKLVSLNYSCSYTSNKTDYGYEDHQTYKEGFSLKEIFKTAIYQHKAHECKIIPTYHFYYKDRYYDIGGTQLTLSIEGVLPHDEFGYTPITDYKQFNIRLTTKNYKI